MQQIDSPVIETSNNISVPDLEISQQELVDDKVFSSNRKGISYSESSRKSNQIDLNFSELMSSIQVEQNSIAEWTDFLEKEEHKP